METAYDSYNNVWAFVGTNCNGVQVQIYNSTESGKPERRVFPRAEKCLSRMIHTPDQPGTEDYILKTQISSNLVPDDMPFILARHIDMTNPRINYSFGNPQIVYNSHTRSFLAIWIQKSNSLGEQLVGQVFRYNKNKNEIDSWEEPRVISTVGLELRDYTDGDGNWIMEPGNFNRIFSPNIDVTTNYDYAIVSARIYDVVVDIKKLCPLIRLVPMGLQDKPPHPSLSDPCFGMGTPGERVRVRGHLFVMNQNLVSKVTYPIPLSTKFS